MELRHRPVASLLAISATLLLLAACGGGDTDPPESADQAVTGDDLTEAILEAVEEAVTGGPRDTTPEPARTVEVNHTIWHSGFEIEFSEAILSEPRTTGAGYEFRTLTIPLRITNLGDDQGWPRLEANVIADGLAIPSTSETDLPSVPGGLTGTGTLVFSQVEDPFDLDSAYLLLGGPSENQARVPLGPQGGELVDLAPYDVEIGGEITLSVVDLVFTGGHVRADTPHNHQSVSNGERTIYLYFDGAHRRQGNWSLSPESFALTLPDGSSVTVEGADLPSMPGPLDGWQGVGPVEDGIESVVTANQYVRFLIPETTAGEYTLRYRTHNWSTADEQEEGTLTFVLTD
jgi:hypothetical protein